MTTDHYSTVRIHFINLLGQECVVCGTSFNLEIHHKEPLGTNSGRGRDKRMWEWFDAYQKHNLSLLCKDCHMKIHNNKENDD